MTSQEQPTVELDLANEAAKQLSPYGEVSLAYITAEFAPFSNQFRPDIIFTPAPRSPQGPIFIVELRLLRKQPLDSRLAHLLPEHRDFVSASSELPTRFALATDEDLHPSLKSFLSENDIKLFGKIQTSRQLADSILEWTRRP